MQHKVIEQQKSDEAKEQVEIRKKILALAEMMQYDDDAEESRVTEHREAKTSNNSNQEPKASKEQPNKDK